MSSSRVGKSPVDTGVPTPQPQGARLIQFEAIDYVNLTDRVYSAIKDRILSQEIEVGSRLRDDELTVQLGVSRTPVREAIVRLAQEGLVEIIPRSGTRVRTFSEKDIEDIWDLRAALEALAVRKAVRHIDAAQLEHLRSMHDKSKAGIKAGETRFALEFDQEMHRFVLQASGNGRLQDIMATINDLVELFRNIGAKTPFHRGFTYRHREILRALERRDATAAACALSEHIERSKMELLRDFHQRKLLEPSVAEAPRHARAKRHRRATGAQVKCSSRDRQSRKQR